jgi:glycosyltransferase involved in cell wall biosynthesis
MTNTPLVSVILIFLDEEKFLQEAIESVIAQRYAAWELLLVDDGSTDGSTKIALSHVDQYPAKVRYLEHADHHNLGMSASRNLGICQAKGEYIAFLDADDVWLPGKLEEQVAILLSQPEAGMVLGAIEWWYSWTGDPKDIHRDRIVVPGAQPNTLAKPPKLLTSLLRHENVSAISSMVRRRVVDEVGGFEESFRGMYEDQAFLAKVYLKAPVFVAKACWYRWRKHQDSCCAISVSTGEYHSRRLSFLNWLANYLSHHAIRDSEVWSVLEDQRWQYRHPALSRLSRHGQYLAQQVKGLLWRISRRTMPIRARRWLLARWHGSAYYPPVGCVSLGSLRGVVPISRKWGFDRGLPIDRYYIERFLSAHAADIQGRVLEIQDNAYTRRFGGDRVTRSDVLHAVEGNREATIVADLTCADHLASRAFDCVILTQTLQFIYDVHAALKTVYRILRPGGVLFVTCPGISQISRNDYDRWGDYWRFTTLSVQRLLEKAFPPANVRVEAYGNVLAATAFLQGLATQEFRPTELDYSDPDYQVLITARAVKPDAPSLL